MVYYHPPALMIEPTNICNLHCPLCPSGNGTLTRPKGFMPLERYQHILEQVSSHTGMLILWNQGEPFLHRDFYQMLELASKMGFYTMTSTNASLPLDTKRILSSGLNKLIISMDGISSVTYNQYRINGDFELVLANLKDLCARKKSLRSHTEIVWQFIVMSHNEHELTKVYELGKEIGVDSLEIKTAQIYTEEDITFVPSQESHSRYKKGSIQLKTKVLNRCRRLWTQPVINWDGEFSICCYDKDLQFKVGNIDQYQFKDLWFGSKLNAIRNQILHNRSVYDICRNCGEGIVQKL